MKEQWKLGLLILGGLMLTVFLVYAASQAVNEVEHVIATGISRMYSPEE
jgi:hypothetical protein